LLFEENIYSIMKHTNTESYIEDADEEDSDDIYETMDDSPTHIEKGLYIGTFMTEQNMENLQRLNVTHIIQVAEGLEPSHPEKFKYYNVNVKDLPSEDLVQYFSKCFAFIDEAIDSNSGVLVHCMAGISRSATVCIGYMMWKNNLSYDEAFQKLHRVRPWIMPSDGFKKQLIEIQKLRWDYSLWKPWQYQDELYMHLYHHRPCS